MTKEHDVPILRTFILEVQIYIWVILSGWLQQETLRSLVKITKRPKYD